MDPKIKRKWLAALRSGEYVQGKGNLLSIEESGEHSFCCLGVLCDLHSRETGQKWEVKKYDNVFSGLYNVSRYLENCNILPSAVEKWAGDNIPNWTLADMNDNGKSFKTIANYIEKEI